ncbi:MAG: hypothetical protein M0P71_01410 [Melioribacteraceae bacterium]|nr:hypothetical protein [Melioribacteraceae bacterium]
MKLVMTLYKNGTLIKKITKDEILKLTPAKIKLEIRKSFYYHFGALCKYRMEQMINNVAQKDFDEVWKEQHPEEVTLKSAYELAINASKFYENGNIGMFNIMDLSMLDNLLPMHGDSNTGHGWWILHEIGAPGMRVGGSSVKGFVNRSLLEKIFGDNLFLSGRFGEGYMVDITSEFWSRFHLKPHKGIVPQRYLTTMQNLIIKDVKLNRDFFQKVINTAFIKIFTKG